MKKLLIIILVIVFAAALFFVFRGRSTKAESKYTTAVIQRGDIAINVTATGTLEAVTTVQVGSQISGTISALYVDYNDQVKKGQILAQLDPNLLKAQVAQAEADLQKADASEQLAKTEYDRALSLFDRNLIAASDRDAALATYQQAQADVESSKANLARLKTNLNYATITSPINGVVISRNVDVGQTVAASLQAPTLFTIAQDLTKMQVKTSIDEADIGRIKEGQNAIFTVDAYPEQTFQGTVKQVRLNPEIVQNVVSYDVILAVSNPDLLLKPGMTANVIVQIDHRDDVLKAPAAALRFHPSGQQGKQDANFRRSDAGAAGNGSDSTRHSGMAQSQFHHSDSTGTTHGTLWILNPQGKPEPVRVQVGLSDGSSTQVISDSLHEGERVIVGQEGAQATAGNQQVNPFMPRMGGGRR